MCGPISSDVRVKFWACFEHVWDMFLTCGYFGGGFQAPILGHVLDMFWTCAGPLVVAMTFLGDFFYNLFLTCQRSLRSSIFILSFARYLYL